MSDLLKSALASFFVIGFVALVGVGAASFVNASKVWRAKR